jgi:predicted RNase H-like nuclease (RuvC/YqgF family)
MTFAKPEHTDDEEQPADDAERGDEQPEDRPDEPPEEVVVAFNHNHDEVDQMSIPDDRELPLQDAVEATGIVVERTFHELREQHREMEGSHDETRAELAAARDQIDNLHEEIRQLRSRVESLEGWKGNASQRLNTSSENIRKLLTASDIDTQGLCPECNDAPLEVKKPFGKANRIECAGDDCDHVAAELE